MLVVSAPESADDAAASDTCADALIDVCRFESLGVPDLPLVCFSHGCRGHSLWADCLHQQQTAMTLNVTPAPSVL